MTIKGLYQFFHIALMLLLLLPDAGGQEYSGDHIIDSLTRIALENNPEILSSRYAQESEEFKARFAGAIPDPQFTITASNLPRTSLSLDETPMSGIALGLSQSIPWPGKLRAQKGAARLKSDNMKEDIRQRENSIKRMIRHYYYEYSYWMKAGQVLDSNIGFSRLNTSIAESHYANGTGNKQDVLRSHTTEARLANKRLYMLQMSRTALLNLGRIIDDTSIVSAGIPVNIPENLNGRPSKSELNNPNLIKAKIQISISDKNLSLAKSGHYPNIMLGFEYRIREDMPMDAIRGEDFVSFKAGFQLPLWFFTRQKNDTKSARLTLKASEEKYRSIRNHLAQEISTVELAMTTIAERFEQYNNSIRPQAKAAYDAARAAYENGETDFNTVMAAQRDLFEIELERIELVKNYWQKSAEYSELIGE